MYLTHRYDVIYVRENARSALNATATQTLASALIFVCLIGTFVWMFATIPTAKHSHVAASIPTPMIVYFAFFAAYLLSMFVQCVLGAFGARVAWLGRVFVYPFAIPFVREPVRASSPE